MIKIGILSMQRILNYGSFLQSYGLKKIFEDLNCKVEFVDYHPGKCLIENNKSQSSLVVKLGKIKKILCSGASISKNFKYIKFKKNFSNFFNYLELTKDNNYYPELDMLVIGSDEVFNCVQDNVNVGYSLELFGQGNKAKRLISYAASFGNTTVEKLKKFNVDDEISKLLNNFDELSVRDNNSLNIVKLLTDKQVYRHIDPVLAYGFPGLCNDDNIIPEKGYLVLYGYTGRFDKNSCKIIKKYAKQKNLKVYCIGGVQAVCDKFINCSPFEVFAYFKNAEVIITDTFHGTIFSILTHKKFGVFVRNDGYGNSEKLLDLLNLFSLNSHIVDDVNHLSEKLALEVDYEAVDKIISFERKKTYEYLNANINACGV